jgi:hypothetical protein
MFEQHVDSDTKASEEEAHEQEGEEKGVGALSPGLLARGGGGIPLPHDLRGEMEASFKHDFSAVRVHQGSPLALQLGAIAFTYGNDLHFAPGAYDPASPKGRELIAHELTHVIQQGGEAKAPQGFDGDLAGTAELEAEADAAGASAARGEAAQVHGTGSGIHFKGPSNQDKAKQLLLLNRTAQVEQAAKESVATIEKRLAAKAELRFTSAENGQLFKDLEAAAADEVGKIADSDGTLSDEGKTDLKDKKVSTKIAQRDKSVKKAIGTKSADLAKTLAAAKKPEFTTAAEKGFDSIKPSKLTISPKAVLNDAIAAAKAAARKIEEGQYKDAKDALDADLQAHNNYRNDLDTESRREVETRAREAITTRTGNEQKLEDIATKTYEPHFKKLDKEIEDYLVDGLGANGAGWWRSEELKTFRQAMKDAGRLQARKDIDTEMAKPGGQVQTAGKATQRYVGMEAKLHAYDTAKVSVNEALHEKALSLKTEVLTNKKVEDVIYEAARQAAFLVYEDDGHMPAATTAATAAAKAKAAEIHDDVLAKAKELKNKIVKPQGVAQQDIENVPERKQVKEDVVKQVDKDDVGEKAVEVALKASGPEEGMSKIGHFFDFIVPERGDAVKFKISLEVPAGPGNVLLELQGDAERGTRGRLLHLDRKTNTSEVHRDTQSLQIGAELRIGYTGSLPGVKLSGAIGFFMRSESSDTDKCLKGLSYGIYRFLANKIPPLANLWGGSHSKAVAMSNLDDGTHPTKDTNLEDDVYRAELWAAMVEEQVFKKDHSSRVDLGMSANFNTEVNAGVFKAKGGLRGELMKTFDHEAFKKNIKHDKRLHGGTSDLKIGDDSFDKDGAQERREKLTGRTVGGFQLDTEAEFKVAEQTLVVGLKFKIDTGGDWSLDLSGGIKVSSGDKAQAGTRLAMGIAGAAQNGVKSIIGVIRSVVDKDHPVAGSIGNVVDGLTRGATSANDIANNAIAEAINPSTQVFSGKHELVNRDVENVFSSKDTDNEYTRAGGSSETMYKFTVSMGANKFLIKIDEVQTLKALLGSNMAMWSGPFGNLEYEKSRRVAQIGATRDDKKLDSKGKVAPGWGFHVEGFGVSNK